MDQNAEELMSTPPESPKSELEGENFSDDQELEEDDYDDYEDYLDNITYNYEENNHKNNNDVAAALLNVDVIHSYATFDRIYNCYPLSLMGKSGMESGNRIIMPRDVLMFLEEARAPSPFMFKIQNVLTGKFSHCGVFDFIGENKKSIFLPEWMMKTLGLNIGDTVSLKSTELAKGKKFKLQPHTKDFMETELRAVLEYKLRDFYCLTAGETIVLSYGTKTFHVNVVETEPENAICIVDTDCEVDFAPPLDYKDAEKACCAEVEEKLKNFTPFADSSAPSNVASIPRGTPIAANERDMAAVPKLVPFSGSSYRLDGRVSAATEPSSVPIAGTSNQTRAAIMKKEEKKVEKFQPFTGKKYSLTD